MLICQGEGFHLDLITYKIAELPITVLKFKKSLQFKVMKIQNRPSRSLYNVTYFFYHFQQHTFLTKLVDFLCCTNICRDGCCECCLRNRGKIRKEDIQHTFRQQPAGRLDSTNSTVSSTSGAMPSPSYRDRISSDRSWRTSSTSSQNGADSGGGGGGARTAGLTSRQLS